MFFSYAVRSVYIESCSLFVRGASTAWSARPWGVSRKVAARADVRLHPDRPTAASPPGSTSWAGFQILKLTLPTVRRPGLVNDEYRRTSATGCVVIACLVTITSSA